MLRFVAAGALGAFAGAMLTEGLVLVPFWRSIPTESFYEWYRANHARLVGFFGPMTWLAAGTALTSAIVSVSIGSPGRWPAGVASFLSLVVVLMFPIYFRDANAHFAAGRLPADVLREELSRWAAWHRVRSGLSVAAFAAALFAA